MVLLSPNSPEAAARRPGTSTTARHYRLKPGATALPRNIIYIVGVVVIVLLVLGYFGMR
ncbi:hypothetical protein [uncultured Phenylobacterium sp.]|uniref:hypothetical protein n=1 Tax=uncultured Phenylobacterium sp. TaxID=349273 RepID=UPI0025D32C95|nr:hypothetical protein [uncultured Phenylobacterium sp.]